MQETIERLVAVLLIMFGFLFALVMLFTPKTVHLPLGAGDYTCDKPITEAFRKPAIAGYNELSSYAHERCQNISVAPVMIGICVGAGLTLAGFAFIWVPAIRRKNQIPYDRRYNVPNPHSDYPWN